MASKTSYETLEDVRQAFLLWESEGKSYAYGCALWQKAEALVRASENSVSGEDEFATAVYWLLFNEGILKDCLTDGLRRLIIRYHARAISTTLAVEAILKDPAMKDVTPFYVFKYSGVCGYKNIRDFLVERLGYLKRGHPRWPAKFEALWHEERAAYVDRIKAIPLTQPIEQLNKLEEHYEALETEFAKAERAIDKERYHKCMIRTMGAIHTLTRDPSIRTGEHALTSSDTPKALESPNSENVLEFSATPVVVETK